LRCADRRNEHRCDPEQRNPGQVPRRKRERIDRQQVKISEGQNGQQRCRQSRAEAGKPRDEDDRAQKQRHRRSRLQQIAQQAYAAECRGNGQEGEGVP
jgi:hypothetical protein